MLSLLTIMKLKMLLDGPQFTPMPLFQIQVRKLSPFLKFSLFANFNLIFSLGKCKKKSLNETRNLNFQIDFFFQFFKSKIKKKMLQT